MGGQQSKSCSGCTACDTREAAAAAAPGSDGSLVVRGPAQVLGPYTASLLRGLPKPRRCELHDRAADPPVSIQIVSDLHMEFLETVFELPPLGRQQSTLDEPTSLSSASSEWSSGSDEVEEEQLDVSDISSSQAPPRANSFAFLFLPANTNNDEAQSDVSADDSGDQASQPNPAAACESTTHATSSNDLSTSNFVDHDDDGSTLLDVDTSAALSSPVDTSAALSSLVDTSAALSSPVDVDRHARHSRRRRQQRSTSPIIENSRCNFDRQAALSTFQLFVHTAPVKSSFLALLGDIGHPEFESYTYFLRWCSAQYERVFVLAGDHEGFGLDRPWSETLEKIAAACAQAGDNVIFCYKTAVEMENFRILATTLWTDVTTEQRQDVEELVRPLGIGLIDEHSRRLRLATSTDISRWHHDEVAWLRKEISEHPDTPTLILTHHAPLMCCLEPGMTPNDPQAQFYCSNLADLFTEPVVAWAFGHTHFPMDCRIGPVRLVSNPAGYPNQDFPSPHGRPYRPNFVLEF